jgi:hypothetical protein
MKITVDKIKILGITIPTNRKYEDFDLSFVKLLPPLFLAVYYPTEN